MKHRRSSFFLRAVDLILIACLVLGLTFNAASPASAQPGATLEVCATCTYTTIQAAVDAANPGDTVLVKAGTYVLSGTVTVAKANLTIAGEDRETTLIQTSGTGTSFFLSAEGITFRDLHVEKTDTVDQHKLLELAANNITIKDNTFSGKYVMGDPQVSRAMVVRGGLSGILIEGNIISSMRQPAYIDPNTTGIIRANEVKITRGWVIDGARMEFLNNTWGSGADSNYMDIALLPPQASTDPSYIGFYADLPGISAANNNAVIENQRATPRTLTHVFVDDSAAAGGDGTPTKPYQKITDAITRVVAGGTVHVYPGDYNETAAGMTMYNGQVHQFGLFIGQDKSGITIQGVNASGAPINNYAGILANVQTNATNNFGPSGVYVEGDQVTITGLKIWQNPALGTNKTIEVIGDQFALKYSHIYEAEWGSVYINDPRYATDTDTSHVQGYTLEGNFFENSSLDINSGAGYTGPVSGRVIRNNNFEYAGPAFAAASISFTGSETGVPWFVQSVGGAVIEGNSFINSSQFIRARGTYDNTQFDWASYFNDNTFDRAAIVGANPPADVRTYSYPGSYGTISNVRRIGATIAGEIEHAQAGDTVLVKAGEYLESPVINQSLTLLSTDGRDETQIVLQPGSTYLGALTIDAPAVTVSGFTITGFDAVGSGLASTNIYVTNSAENVEISDNRVEVGKVGTGSNGDDGFGLITAYSTTSDVDSLTVKDNTFEPVNAEAQRAFYINPGVNQFFFQDNQITGLFKGTALTQAKDGLVENNVITGAGPVGSRSGGLGTWGDPDSAVYGDTLFRGNTFSGTRGISLYDTQNVVIEENIFSQNSRGVWITAEQPGFNLSAIEIIHNSFTGNDTYGVEMDDSLLGTVKAECNWWGNVTGPSGVGSGTGDAVTGHVDFDPWCQGDSDLSITVTDNRLAASPSDVIEYTIAVKNLGSTLVAGALVTDTVPALLHNVTWTCTATSGSQCDASGSGSSLSELVNLAAGGQATFVVRGTLVTDTSGTLTNQASVAIPTCSTDPDLANNSATDTTQVVVIPVTSGKIYYFPLILR